MVVWVVEHREMAGCDKDCMDTVVMDIFSSLEKAEADLKTPSTPETKGWFVIYPEVVDGARVYHPEIMDNGMHRIFNIYDLEGNRMSRQPTHGESPEQIRLEDVESKLDKEQP
jgi:hypothetical protein